MNQIEQLFRNSVDKRLIILPDWITLEDVSQYLQSKEYLSQF